MEWVDSKLSTLEQTILDFNFMLSIWDKKTNRGPLVPVEGSYDDIAKNATPRNRMRGSIMKEAIGWIQGVLKELARVFPDDRTKPNVTLPDENKDVIFVVFNFVAKDNLNAKMWFGFGVTEEDLSMEPVDLVAQVKDDLRL